VLPGEGSGSADGPLVDRAKAERARAPGAIVAVATKDWGIAERARSERVKTVLLRGYATAADLERGIADHDSVLDMDL
jgi:hypothetical protein